MAKNDSVEIANNIIIIGLIKYYKISASARVYLNIVHARAHIGTTES